jgi:hypothetical protein
MELSFLTPFAALFALAALVPLAVTRHADRRARRIRNALGLDEPPWLSRYSVVAALVAVCGLLGLAAAQPVVATTRSLPERSDAQVFAVLDTSRSMLASENGGAPTRLERARRLALEVRDALPDVPLGLASLTDRLLPHLFPTTDRRVVAQTLEDSIAIEQPPPRIGAIVATTFDALAAAERLNYFPPRIAKRVLVVFTDGETRPLQQDLGLALQERVPIEVLFVHVWGDRERIYTAGVPEAGYGPDPESRAKLSSIASSIGGEVFDETSAVAVADAVRKHLGAGETITREHEGTRYSLMPWLTLAALLPLCFVLLRRNVSWGGLPGVRARSMVDVARATRAAGGSERRATA